MRREIYQTGQLIEAIEDAETLLFPPNWTGWNLDLLSNEPYNRMANETSERLALSRLENYSISLASSGNEANYPIFISLWNKVVSGYSGSFTPEELAGWNAIAQTNNLPVTLNGDGVMSGTVN